MVGGIVVHGHGHW